MWHETKLADPNSKTIVVFLDERGISSVDFLKIDGMFVKGIVHNKIDRAMVDSISNVGHVMGLHTIAEFAENDEIIQVLKEIGVDYAQGYGIAKPCPVEDVFIVARKQAGNG